MFQSLDEYYIFLESQSDLLWDQNVSTGLKKLLEQSQDEILKKETSYELYIQDFNIVKNELKKRMSYPDNNGIFQEYPSFNLFNDDLEYLKLRAKQVLNLKLKAKYNHILWLAPVKNRNFAVSAVDNYLAVLKETNFDPDDTARCKAFSRLFENLFLLSQQVSYNEDTVLEYIISLIGNGKINVYEEYCLMSFIAESGKKINSTLTFFSDYCTNVIENPNFSGLKKEFLKLQIFLTQKIGRKTAPFYNKLAELYLDESEKHKEGFVLQSFYLKAVKNYQKAGNKMKVEETTLLMEKAKNNLNLKSVKFESSSKEINLYCDAVERNIEDLLLNHSTDDIYRYLITSPNIFPKAKELEKDSDSQLMRLVSVTKFDQNRNISAQSGGIFNNYDFTIKGLSIFHLKVFFQKGFSSGKLSFESLHNYILNETWYGEDAEHVKSDGSATGFKWANLILPALQSFFDQLHIDSSTNKIHNQAYMQCIDSLVLKFEGLLREFSRKIGAQTIEVKENSTEERIAFDKLLDNKKLIEVVPDDDIALFKYIFTSKGINLRNNVAHCFYKPMEYRIQWMWLLISSILKLGNYKFTVSS